MKAYVLTFVLILFTLSCGGTNGELPTYEYMPNMMDSPAVKAQEQVMREPVPGTRTRGFQEYPFSADQGDLAAEKLGPNPLEFNKENLMMGKNAYNTFCIVCHGPKGKGNGTVVPKFPMPPSLHSDKVKTWPDARIFHVITKGQNLMSSYATQVRPEERWAIIYYIRALQRSQDPTNEDIKKYKDWLMQK